jgi:hypothetical protein
VIFHIIRKLALEIMIHNAMRSLQLPRAASTPKANVIK